MAVHVDGTGGGFFQKTDAVEQSGFARAGWSGYRVQLAFVESRVHMGPNDVIREAL
jgi:hypothetical protein